MSGKTLDAVGIGACNLDMVAFVPKFTEKEEKINASLYVPPRAAGVAVDAITQVAYLGGRCGFIGKRGDDWLGKLFDEEIGNDNIDMSRAIRVEGEMTSLAWIQVTPNGERCHVIIPMSRKGFFTTEEIDERAEYLQNARLCHIELLQMPVAPLLRAAQLCRRAGTLVSVDLDIAPRFLYDYKYATSKELDTLFQNTDILKAGKNAVATFPDADDLQAAAVELLELGPRVVVITMGERGCLIASREDGKIKHFNSPAFTDTGVKDTTGAGDAFQGGFISGYLQGWPLERCAVLANACGYLKSLNVGARNMPKREVVEGFLRLKGWAGL